MNTLAAKYWENALTFEQYIDLIDGLLEVGKSTGPNQSEALFDYSKLNRSRMKRLIKTTRLLPEVAEQLVCVQQPMKWLVITEGWCGDAAQIVPVLWHLAKAHPQIEVRFVLRDDNLELMDQFLTNGGRSIPKVIVLDAEFSVRGSWGPRPQAAQDLFNATRTQLEAAHGENWKAHYGELQNAIQLWYAKDKTKSIQREIGELMAAAATPVIE